VVKNVYNPSTQKAETGRLQFKASLGYRAGKRKKKKKESVEGKK
jgi:hypothetical protein